MKKEIIELKMKVYKLEEEIYQLQYIIRNKKKQKTTRKKVAKAIIEGQVYYF